MSDPAFPEKISHKIRLYLIVTFSAVALTGAVSIISTRNIFLSSKKINSLNQHIKIMDQFHILFHHLIDELHRAIILKTLDRQEHIRDLEQELKEQLVRYRAEHLGEIPSPEQTLEMTLVEEIQRSTAQLLSLSGSIQKLIAKRQKIPNEQFGLLDGIAHTIPPVNQQLNELHLKEIRGLIQENTSRMDMIFWIYLGFLAFGTVATVLGIRKFSTAIIHPLQLLTSATVEVGSGAQGKRIDVASKDEFGQLSHFFNEMLETLENRERELRASQRDLARHVRELEALHRINVEISGLLDLDQVLKLVVEKARELMGTDLASLCTPAADGNGFTPQTVSSPERLSGLFEANRRCTFQESSHSDLPGPECAIPLEYRRAYLSAPLKRGDHIAGVLCVGCKS
ncbi:MAG: HAMP domain-containing protein, partial [Candidatus Tectomicrobia bacterium]|nr:HAMP domain-containing protein [Candidatus Tectomicrobia bacterium]